MSAARSRATFPSHGGCHGEEEACEEGREEVDGQEDEEAQVVEER
jgi:hypothetical protein